MQITIGRANATFSQSNEAPLPTVSDSNVATEQDHIVLGGVRVHGVKLESVESARAILKVELKAGNFIFPGAFDKVETRIMENCSAEVTLNVGKNKAPNSALKIKTIAIALSEPIVIENPASAFLEKRGGFFGRAVSLFADQVAKVYISGIQIDEDGLVHFDGNLLKGGLFNSPLSEVIGDVPAFNLDIRHLISTVNPNQKDKSFGLEFMQSLGQVVGHASYAMDVNILPTVLSIDHNSTRLQTQRQPAKAHIQGNLSLNESLDFSMTADSESSFLDTLFGHMIVGGSLKIDRPLEQRAHLAFKVKGTVTDLPQLDLNSHCISAKGATLSAEGSADLLASGKLVVANGSGQLAFDLIDPRLRVANASLHLDGNLGAKLCLRDLEVDRANRSALFRGSVAGCILENYSSRTLNQPWRAAQLDFRLHQSGRLSVSPAHDNAKLFDLPFNEAYQTRRLSKTTPKNPVREGNRVELLVDGLQSYPRRLEMIAAAKESIWLQTLIFQDDISGMFTAKALTEAVARGVSVRVIVDGQGSADDLLSAMADNKAFKLMREGGVDLRIHNDSAIRGLRDVVDVIVENKLAPYSKDDLLRGSITQMVGAIANVVIQLQQGQVKLPSIQQSKLIAGINSGLGRAADTPINADRPIFSVDQQGSIELTSLIERAQEILHQVYSWHEKHFIVDGQRAILGGMNIADAYMFGGRVFRNRQGKISAGWRDTDLLIEGPSIDDAAAAFAKNYLHLTGNPITARKYEPDDTNRLSGKDVKVQIIQHSPSIDGDNHITGFLVDQLNRLEPGESAVFENAYFCVSSSLSTLFDSMIKAAKRGVHITVLTNSATTSDLPAINNAAFHTYRDLMKAGVRIFERKDERTIHSKIAVIGKDLSIVGSANLDNRSARINSEVIAAVYDEEFANKQRAVIKEDLSSRVAREITMEDLAAVTTVQSAQFAAMSLMRDFC